MKINYELMGRRFMRKIDVPDDPNACWIYPVSKGMEYGLFSYHGKRYAAHRISWAIYHERMPKKHILHKCDNPPCVNPAHLFEGTASDNMQDAKAKGRLVVPRITKLTREEIEEIRRMGSKGVTQKMIAEAYEVDRSTVSLILRGKIWK